jgi:hypothetical protein
MTDREILTEITNWLATHFPNEQKSSWYVGIASDIQSRLFGDHNVHPQNNVWIHRQATNANHARSAEATLLSLGYDGGRSGGDHTTVHVYAFRKDPGTAR